MNAFAFSGLLVLISSLFFGFFVFFKNTKSRTNQIWGLFSLSVSIWGIAVFKIGQIPETERALAVFWWRITYLGIIFIPILFYHFICVWLGLRRKTILYLFYLWGIFFFGIQWTPWGDLFIGYNNMRWVFSSFYVVGPTPLFNFFVLSWFSIVIYSHYQLYKALKKSVGLKRNQIKYFFLAPIIGFAGGGLSFPMCYGFNVYPYANFAVPLYPAIMAYAIVKYHLMDITVLAVRGIIFFFVYGILLFFPLFTFFSSISAIDKIHIGIYALFASAAPFVYLFLQKRAEDIILKEQRYYQQILTNLSKSMINIRDLELLLKTVSLTILQAVKVPFLSMYLKDDEHQAYRLKSYYPYEIKSKFQEFIPFDYPLIKVLNKQKRPLFSEEAGYQDKIYIDSGVVIPCFGKEGLLAIIVFGVKPNGRMYTPDDLLVFENLSYSVSLAIENCTFWKQIEERQRLARVEEMNLFSYSLAHEIDNPMTIIIGNAGKITKFYVDDMNLSENHKKELKSTFDQISEAAWRVSGMVKAIQEFGERTSGEAKPINLKNTIATFLKLYTAHLKMNAVDFTKDIPEELPLIMGVSQEIEQVLVIFSNNAVHALLGKKNKKINLKVEVVNPHWIKIIFSDNGYGILEKNLLTIFSAFVTTKASSEGTGMGLYNAKNIISRHNGKIWAESEGEGKGARFIIELPIAKDIKPEEKEGHQEF